VSAIRLCLVGLPETGKTTYIAALWAYVNAPGPVERYRIVRQPKDAKYLTEIADAWVRGLDMPRNDSTEAPNVSFEIGAKNKRNLEFRLPDLRGEVFKTAVTKSQADQATIDSVMNADVILFVVSTRSATTFAALAELGFPAPPEGQPEPDVVLDDLDTDFLNTELLQKLRYLFVDTKMPPILVLVSAWDRMEDAWEAEAALTATEGREPEAFPVSPREVLANIQPGFAQFLDEIGRQADIHIIGLSSTGGDVKSDSSILERNLDERSYAVNNAGSRTHIAHWLDWFEELAR
jgi:hypothetical protein